MAGKNIPKEIEKQLINAPAEVVKNMPFTQLLDNATEKPKGKEASPVYKGKTVLPLKKTEKGTTKIDASPKEIAEFVKTSSKVKGMVKDINFDALNNDITKLNKRIMSMDGGWKSKKEMDDIVTSVKDMNDRIGAFEEYRKKYSETNLSDLSELKTAYDDILKELEHNSSVFSNYGSAEEYKKAEEDLVKKQSELEGMKTVNLKVVRNEIALLEEILKNIENKEQNIKLLKNKKSTWEHRSNGYSDGGYGIKINDASDELNEYLKSVGYGSIDDLKNALGEKKMYLNRAEWVQKGIEMASVSDESSKNYDKDFDKKSKYVSPEYGWIYLEDKDEEFYKLINGGVETPNETHAHMINSGYQYMTEQEIATYNYYYNTSGADKAAEYLKTIAEDLGTRKATADFERYKGKTGKELLYGVQAGFDQFASGMKNFLNFEDGYIPVNAIQQLSGMVREDLINEHGNWGKVPYDFITTTSNMLPSILTSSIIGKINPALGAKVGAGLMGVSASGNAYQEMLNLGYNKGQAKIYSYLVGASEAVLQNVLGGIGKLGGTSGKIAKLVDGIDNGLAKFAIQAPLSAASEGLEEAVQEILTPLFENIVAGYDNGADVDWSEVVYSGLLGALSGGFLEGGPLAVNTVAQNSYNKAMGQNIKNNKQIANVLNIISEADTPSAYEVINQYEKKGINADNITDAQLGKLYTNAMLDAQEVIESKTATAEQVKAAEGIIARLQAYAQDKSTRTTENAESVKLAHEEASKKQSPLPQAIVEGNKTTEALYRDASLGNISLQLAKMGYLESDLKDVAQTLVNYAKGQISEIDVEKILSIPQADAIAQMIEQDVNLRELIADPKAQSVASGETLGNLVTKAKASKSEAELFRSEIDLFYAAGKNNISYAEVERMYSAKSLSSDERMAAYYRGLENAQRVYTLKNGNIVEKKMNGNIKGGLLVNDGARRLTNIQKRFLMKLGETLNKTITIQDGLRNDKGQRVSGFINDTAVFIDASVKDPIMWTATHEFSHQMQELAPEAWAKYRAYVIKIKEKKGTYESGLETYKKDYGDISETELQDEMASDFTEKLFKNEKDLLDFINHSKSLATKVKDIWFNVLDKFNIPYKEDARSLWERCYREATKKANKGESKKSGDVRYKVGEEEKENSPFYVPKESQENFEKQLIKYNDTVEQLKILEDLSRKTPEVGYKIQKLQDFLREPIDIGKTSFVLRCLGAEEIKMVITTSAIRKATSGVDLAHSIPITELSKLLKELSEPIMVFDSKTDKKKVKGNISRSLVVLTSIKNIKGHNSVVVVHLNKKKGFIEVNDIASIYTKTDDVGRNKIKAFIEDQISLGNLRYIDKNRSEEWLRTSGLQLPTVNTIIASDNNILQREDIVNSYSMQNGGNNSQNGRSRISSAAEANRENLDSEAEYERTHAAELAKENARLRKTIEDMHMQLSQNDGSGVNMDVVRDVAKDIKAGYYSKVNGKELQRELAGLYTYMQGRDVDGEEVNRRARAIADKVVESAIIKNNELYNEYGDLLDRIKNTRIRVSDYDKADFKDGFEYYRKHYTMGKLRLTNDGMELDVFWDELAKEYPHLIENDMYGAEERLNRLLEIREDFQPVYENIYGEQAEEIKNKLTEDIKESFYKVPEGTGEKKAIFYDTRSADIKKAMEKMQKQHDEAFRKLDEKYTRLIKRAEAEKAKAEKQRDYYHNRLDKQKILPAIHRNFNYLSKMLLDPTDSRHIPQEMRPMVAEFLRMFKSEAIDSELFGENKVLSVTATKKAQLYDAYTKIMNELTQDDGILVEGGKPARIDPQLLAELEIMKNSIPIEENGQFISFTDMNAYELNIVSRLLKGIHHAVTVQNNLFAAESRRGVRESGEKLIKANKEIASKKKDGMRKSLGDGKGKALGTALDWIDNEWNYNELAPIDVFTRMGGVMEELYQAERKGFNKHIENIKESIAKVQSIVEGTDANKWTGKNAKAEEFVTSAGKIKLTRAQVMSLYALSKRKQALNHILYGGITSDDVKTDKNESLKTIEALHITKDDIINIVATMSEDEKRVADAIVNFITVRGAELGNETSMKLYGYEKFGEQWYFPIKVAGEAVATFYGDRGEGSLLSQSHTKKLVKGAKNPIVITDFFDAAISHMSGMSLYNSVALPMLDMERVLNYSQFSLEEKNEIGDVITPSKFITTARSSLIEAYGEAAESYIAKLHKDINGQTKNSEGDTLFDNILSRSKKVSVGANVRVLLQQPTSISRAFMFLSPVDFAGAKAGKTTIGEMQEHSAIAYWKSLGFYDIEVGRSMKDIMLGNETALEKIAYGGYGKADDMTWGLIWSAVKNETKRLNPDMDVDSKEFFDKVTERFDYIIDRSQVVDSVFHRTQSMRSKNAFTKTETAFMSEPLKNLNLMRTELFIGRRDGTLKKTVPKIVTVTVLNAAMVALMQSIPDLWRDDDDEWNKGSNKDKLAGLADKYAGIVGENFVDNLKVWNQIPYVKTFSSLFGKYGASRFEYSLFEDFAYAIKGMANEKKSPVARIGEPIKATAALFGIPVTATARDITGVAKTAYLLFGKNEYASYNAQKLELDINNPKNKSAFLKYYERAIENGDFESAEMIITDYLMVMSNRPGSDNYIKNVISFIEKGKWKSIPMLTVHSIIPGVGTGGKKAVKDEHVEAQREMVRLYKSTGDDNFIFSVPEQKFTASGVDVALTNEEYADMSISVHDKLMSMAFEFINSDGYEKLSDEEKAAGMRTIKDYAVDSSKKDVYGDFELSSWKQDVYDGYTDIQEKITEKVEATKKKNIGAELYDAFRDGEFEDAMEDYIDDGYSREYLVEAAQSGAAQSEEYKAEVRNNKQEKYNLDGLTTEEKNKFTELKNELATYNAKTKYFPEYSASSWASKFYNDQILVNRGEEEHMKMLVKYDAYKVSIGKDGKTPKKAEIEAFVRSYTADPILRRSIFRAIAPKNYKNSF